MAEPPELEQAALQHQLIPLSQCQRTVRVPAGRTGGCVFGVKDRRSRQPQPSSGVTVVSLVEVQTCRCVHVQERTAQIISEPIDLSQKPVTSAIIRLIVSGGLHQRRS